ncbi:MAG: hypothetical protein ACREEM_28020, partial [Blastocatellia bacterium]
SETQKQQRDQWLALVDHLTPIIQSIEKELAPIAQKEPRVTRLGNDRGLKPTAKFTPSLRDEEQAPFVQRSG